MPPRYELKTYEDFTDKEAALVDAYTDPESPTYRNKVQSYKSAGYYHKGPPPGEKDDGRGDRAARVRSVELFRKPHIKEEVERRFRSHYDSMKMSMEEASARISKMAGIDLMEYLVEVPTVCPHCEGDVEHGTEYTFDIKKMKKDGYGAVLKKMKPTKFGTEFEFYAVDAMLDRMMKHHGAYQQKDKGGNMTFIDKLLIQAKQES